MGPGHYGQCTFVWDSASGMWESITTCADGYVCAQGDPNTTGVTGEDGDVWVSACSPKGKPPAAGTGT